MQFLARSFRLKTVMLEKQAPCIAKTLGFLSRHAQAKGPSSSSLHTLDRFDMLLTEHGSRLSSTLFAVPFCPCQQWSTWSCCRSSELFLFAFLGGILLCWCQPNYPH